MLLISFTKQQKEKYQRIFISNRRCYWSKNWAISWADYFHFIIGYNVTQLTSNHTKDIDINIHKLFS